MISLNANAPDADSGLTVASFNWKWYLSELKPPHKDAPTVFSCFACGGGSSMGYKRAGFNVLGNCEIDPKIAEIYKKNLHPKYSYVMDIRDFNKLDNIPDEFMNLDVLDGSPPCSTFSTAGDREKAWGKEKKFAEGQKLQTLDDLFFIFLDTVEKLQPKIVVAENVTGLIKGNARGYVNQIIKRFNGIGYDVQMFQLDASFMDVPQKRERIFFIANRCKLPKLKLKFNGKPTRFGDVRTEYGQELSSKETIELLKYTKDSDYFLSDVNLRIRGLLSGFNVPIVHDEQVCPTVPAGALIYRFCDKKKFSAQDLLSVSSFPQDYDYEGKPLKFIVGMSVPPNMMAHIASEIRRQWLV